MRSLLLLPLAPSAEKLCSDFASRLAHRRCAIAVSDACCAWIHRRCIWSARRHDRHAANILGSRHPLSGPRLLSCCVCPPKSIALAQPVASLLLPPLPLPNCATLLNPVW